jgi:hypothetical protein
MLLRFIRNLAWYDEPLSDLFLGEKDLRLYISVRLNLDDPKVRKFLVREFTDDVQVGDLGANWPEKFWDPNHHENKLVTFYMLDAANDDVITIKKEYGYLLEFAFVEVSELSVDERLEISI